MKKRKPKLFRQFARVCRLVRKIGLGWPVLPEECKIQAIFFPSRAGSTLDLSNRGELACRLNQSPRCRMGKLLQPGRSLQISTTVCSYCLAITSCLQFASSSKRAYAGPVSRVDRKRTAYPRRFKANTVRMTSKLEPTRSATTGASSRFGSCKSLVLWFCQMVGSRISYSRWKTMLHIISSDDISIAVEVASSMLFKVGSTPDRVADQWDF